MDKELLILAKSMKQGGYCVAGLEIEQTASGEAKLTQQWIRPVTNNPQSGCAGSLSFASCQDFQVFDRVRFPLQGPAEVEGQQENWTWPGTQPIKTGHGAAPDALHSVAAASAPIWFDPRTAKDNTVAADFAQRTGRHDSLLLIQPKELSFGLEVKPAYGQDYLKPVITIDFTHNNQRFHGIHATDPGLRQVFRGYFPCNPGEKNHYRLDGGDAYWLVLSLTLPFHGLRYLLVGGVLAQTQPGEAV